MTRSLTEIERLTALERSRGETIAKLNHGGGLTHAQRELELERLSAINEELASLAAKSAPPPPPPVLKDVGSITAETAAKRAAEIRARPEYWKPNLRDKDGQLVITAEAHANLVREHSELLARAAEDASQAS